MNWNNPGSILNSQSVLSITTKMIEYHSNNCSEYIYAYNYSLMKIDNCILYIYSVNWG